MRALPALATPLLQGVQGTLKIAHIIRGREGKFRWEQTIMRSALAGGAVDAAGELHLSATFPGAVAAPSLSRRLRTVPKE
jgi:hypothetical protein